MKRILLLAGTGEARRIAAALSDLPVVASLAGSTASPQDYPCEVQTGGFGGAKAMADWLSDHQIGAVIDATHPFAARISANAVVAAEAAGVPLTRVDRPPWTSEPYETWINVPDIEAAAAALPTGARAFLATGRGSQAAFIARRDVWCALRLIDPPDTPYPGNGEYVVSRPPFDEAAEKALFERLRITHLVVKNAGGAAARTKLNAAGRLGVPIIVVARPDEPDAAPAIPESQLRTWLSAIADSR